MSKGLSKDDLEAWKQVTKDVTPLGSAPVSPVEGLPCVRVSAPRSVEYHPRMDLHGATIHNAYAMVQEHVLKGAMLGYRTLTVISGRSGQINIEMPRWLERNPHVRSVNPKNGGGAWEICLKRKDT
jgi:hypothetical protein